MSVDFPEPDTPVTQVNKPKGMSTVRFFKLLPVAPWMRICLPGVGGVRRPIEIVRLALKY